MILSKGIVRMCIQRQWKYVLLPESEVVPAGRFPCVLWCVLWMTTKKQVPLSLCEYISSFFSFLAESAHLKLLVYFVCL